MLITLLETIEAVYLAMKDDPNFVSCMVLHSYIVEEGEQYDSEYESDYFRSHKLKIVIYQKLKVV